MLRRVTKKENQIIIEILMHLPGVRKSHAEHEIFERRVQHPTLDGSDTLIVWKVLSWHWCLVGASVMNVSLDLQQRLHSVRV